MGSTTINSASKRSGAAFGGLIAGLAIMLVVGLTLSAASEIGRVTVRDDVVLQAIVQCSHSPNKQNCNNDVAAIASALAAQNAVRVAVWQTMFSLLGLFGLAFTVFYARKAWIAARDSADADHAALIATRDGLDAARKSFAASERPWIVLTEFELTEPIFINPNKFTLRGRFKVKNVGRSIALNAFYNAVVSTKRTPSLEPVRIGLEEEAKRTLEAIGLHSGGFVLAPGDEMEGGFSANFSAADLEGANSPLQPGLFPFVVGTITYRSPNDTDAHQTSFTLLVQRRNPGKGMLDRPPILLTDGVVSPAELEIVRFQSGYTAT